MEIRTGELLQQIDRLKIKRTSNGPERTYYDKHGTLLIATLYEEVAYPTSRIKPDAFGLFYPSLSYSPMDKDRSGRLYQSAFILLSKDYDLPQSYLSLRRFTVRELDEHKRTNNEFAAGHLSVSDPYTTVLIQQMLQDRILVADDLQLLLTEGPL